MARRATLPISLLAVASWLSCTAPGEHPGAAVQQTAGANDVCQECAGVLMTAFAEVISSPRPTIDDVARFVHIEDDFWVASRQMTQQSYLHYINSDHSTTVSRYAQLIKATVSPGANLSRWSARVADEVCEVEMDEAELALTITNRPRCYVTIIRHEGSPLLE